MNSLLGSTYLTPIDLQSRRDDYRVSLSPNLELDEKGVVIFPQISVRGNAITIGRVSEGFLDDLRLKILMWDKIDYPDNNILGHDMDTDLAYLEEVGVLQRSKAVFSVMNGSDGFAKAIRAVYLSRIQSQPGQWAISNEASKNVLADRDTQKHSGLLFKLIDALEIPTADIPLEDILNLREKRRDERLALRYHLDELHSKIIQAGDGEWVVGQQLAHIKRTLADHNRVVRETQFPRNVFTLTSAAVAGVTFAAAAATGAPLLAATITGAAAFAVEVINKTFRGPSTGSPYQYVSSFSKLAR